MPPSLISAVITKKTVQEDWIVRAPTTGVVRSLDVRAGMTLPAGAPLLQINRLDSVWVLVSVPQSQSQEVARGDVADVYIDGVSSPKRQGRIAEILPLLDSASRNVSLRIELENGQGDLRPGLSARVTLHGSEVSHHGGMQEMLVVPTEALIRTGTRTVVMISAGDGLFQPVEVRTGAEKGAVTVIEAGLEDGDRVVVSGQFLLDSEASLQGIPVRLLNDEAPSSHHSHEHSVHEPSADEPSSEGSQP
jgi:Cu(I)/Ag(I) efflux system membrane fusion protein